MYAIPLAFMDIAMTDFACVIAISTLGPHVTIVCMNIGAIIANYLFVSIPITVNTSTTTPAVSVRVNSTQFSISLSRIFELDQNSALVKSINLTNIEFSMTFSNTSSLNFYNYTTNLNSSIVAVYLFISIFPFTSHFLLFL